MHSLQVHARAMSSELQIALMEKDYAVVKVCF